MYPKEQQKTTVTFVWASYYSVTQQFCQTKKQVSQYQHYEPQPRTITANDATITH
jgi:hypothetical protein